MLIWPVASLGLLSPGAATDGVTPIFSWKNCPPVLLITVNFIDFTRCHPFEGVTPDLFHLFDLVSPLFFVNSAHNFFFIPVSTPGRCHPVPFAPCDAIEYGATKPLIDMYISRGFRYLYEIWFAKIAVIAAESRDSLAAVLKINIPTSHWWCCSGELCMPIGLQYTPELTQSSIKLLGQSLWTNAGIEEPNK